MSRIYQGRVCRIERLDGQPIDVGALWEHHCRFQDAVNYYIVALAAMAAGADDSQPEGRAVREWAQQVRESWVSARRRAERFDGPQRRVAPLLGLPADASFEDAAGQILAPSRASAEQRAGALLELLAASGDLNQVCVGRLACLASPAGMYNQASGAVKSAQEAARQAAVRAIHAAHAAGGSNPIALAAELDLGLFFAQPPRTEDDKTGQDALRKASEYFEKAVAKQTQLEEVRQAFEARMRNAEVRFPGGNKPDGRYPVAVIFRLLPCEQTLRAFLDATRSLDQGKDKRLRQDALADARVEDQPQFDYFTNVELGRGESRAAWFEFDLAAFIEAVKSPRRYCEDTIAREAECKKIRAARDAINGRGRDASDEAGEEALDGFEGDVRIDLLRQLVTRDLARLGGEEYSVRRRTLRGWADLRERWRKAGTSDVKRLQEIRADQQGQHRDDFGSAELFTALAEAKYQPIWRDPGTESWHADDPLQLWLKLKETEEELLKAERPIRFTPAHARHSPRFFIFPKAGAGHVEHEAGAFSYTADLVARRERVACRIHYSAPRLRRDGLRMHGASEDLKHEPWLQPMMEALGRKLETVNFGNCAVTLLADCDEGSHLGFPVAVTPFPDNGWVQQCNIYLQGKGKEKHAYALRWPHEKQPAKPPAQAWHDGGGFACLAVDLGQRDAGAFARLRLSAQKPSSRVARSIGAPRDVAWYAQLQRTGLIRLAGEDARVWRERARGEGCELAGVELREELWGERGRPAREEEADQTETLMRALGADPDGEYTVLPRDWRSRLSFPEQNDKLLVALRRYQSRLRRLQRWQALLRGTAEERAKAVKEVGECDDGRLIGEQEKSWAAVSDPRLPDALAGAVSRHARTATEALVAVANRILPGRRTTWVWGEHPAGTAERPLFLLSRQPRRVAAALPVWLRGQRGLSTERIEQITELRQRAQSLSASLRWLAAGEPAARRDDTVPDVCPEVLDRLDRLKRERVRQTAHAIVAEALGLRLRRPQPPTRERRERDLHGAYEKFAEPVELVVIEDLSRYRSDQGRAPRENSRLMQWCHRAIAAKLRELCDVFGLTVMEAPAAYSSRFCSRTGVPGFRAVEVTRGFTGSGHWAWLAAKTNQDGSPTAEARRLREMEGALQQAEQERAQGKPPRTLLVPMAGGPVFVPITAAPAGGDGKPSPPLQQADINAAINLGLRAVADPRDWAIFPRVRTSPAKSGLQANEKRKFGGQTAPWVVLERSSAEGARPNLFADLAGLRASALEHLRASWNEGRIEGSSGVPPLVAGKSFWGAVHERAWPVVEAINWARLRRWAREREQTAGAVF